MRTWNAQDEEGRVVITGLGVVTPLGDNVADFRQGLMTGRSAIRHWKRYNGPTMLSKIGGDMSDFDVAEHLASAGASYPAELLQRAKKTLRQTSVPTHWGACAAMQAYVDAGLPDARLAPEDCGQVIAGHNINSAYIYENALTYQEEPEFIDPVYAVVAWDTDTLARISQLLRLHGPGFTVGNACATGTAALHSALDLIRAGRAQAVMVTGVSCVMDPVLRQGFIMIDVLCWKSFNDDPARASRPFDRQRDGFVPSEGAGAVLLESLASARRRGAHIYAELLGAGMASDGTWQPTPLVEGQVRSMRAALRDAALAPDDIDYVNAHATSTRLGDLVEVQSLKTVFGDRARQIPVNATKSMVGHCLSAAGLVETVATVLQMEHGFVHPTINQQDPDPECDVDCVPNEARDYRIQRAISNSFGFGGLNATAVFGTLA